jgi:hypothetical protein
MIAKVAAGMGSTLLIPAVILIGAWSVLSHGTDLLPGHSTGKPGSTGFYGNSQGGSHSGSLTSRISQAIKNPFASSDAQNDAETDTKTAPTTPAWTESVTRIAASGTGDDARKYVRPAVSQADYYREAPLVVADATDTNNN